MSRAPGAANFLLARPDIAYLEAISASNNRFMCRVDRA